MSSTGSKLPEGYKHPLVKAADIRADIKQGGHPFNKAAKPKFGLLSDKAGLKGMGVKLMILEPGMESTGIHYHLAMTEYIYITKGSGVLQLIDTSKHPNFVPSLAEKWGGGMGSYQKMSPDDIVEHEIGVGDFMGFQAGPFASHFAHGMRAGPEGMECIVGGERPRTDICCFPLHGRVMMFDEDEVGEEFVIHEEPDAAGK